MFGWTKHMDGLLWYMYGSAFTAFTLVMSFFITQHMPSLLLGIGIAVIGLIVGTVVILKKYG